MMKCYRNMVVGCYVILFFLVIYIFGMGMKLIFKFVNKVGGICFRKYLLFLQFLVFRSWQYLKLYLQFVIVWINFQKIFNFNRKFLYFWCQCWLYQVCYDIYIDIYISYWVQNYFRRLCCWLYIVLEKVQKQFI